MPERTDLVYLTDGSFEGMLCCIFESYTKKEYPVDILPEEQPTFYPVKLIQTVEEIAIEGRLNPRCQMSHMPKRFWKHLLEMDGKG